MLFKLDTDFNTLEPIGFYDFSDNHKLEKDLENLIARHLFNTLFENMPLLPFYQERPHQEKADIYAINEWGDLVIFELKRSTVSIDALYRQLFRYTEEAGRWGYTEIARYFDKYSNSELIGKNLKEAHKEAFNLDQPLNEELFNRRQEMWVVGSAADNDLIRAIDFWKKKGLNIDFLPYRVYKIGYEQYFEFFAKPYDIHINPSWAKGVIFDTNRSWDEDKNQVASFRAMLKNERVSAYGDRKEAVKSLSKGDIVFYSHKWVGIVAAAKVVGPKFKADGENELYWDVEFLTPIPTDILNPPAMKFREVKEVTGKSFFWARIQKVPYLTKPEAEHLLEKLNEILKAE